MKTEFQYLTFTGIPLPPERKTRLFMCKNRSSGIALGEVKWYGAWRQYCYFPTVQAVYSTGCLRDIAEFIEQLK